MTTERIPCAIVGASGYIGQHFVRLLADHPDFDLRDLVGGDRSDGRTLSDLWQLAEAPPEEFEGERVRRRSPAALQRAGVRVVFSGLPSGTAGTFESELVRRGVSVFSNASDHRGDPRVPLLVPEVNADHLRLLPAAAGRGVLVTNPNCSATGLALALAPVERLLRPRSVHVATYQALSGAGYPGIPSLAIADNVVPYIRSEEEKLAAETQRILGTVRDRRVRPKRFPLVVQCARVATREGHLEAVSVEAGARPTEASLAAAWREFDPLRRDRLPTAPHPPIVLRTEPDRPQPLRDRWAGSPARARGMAAVVGRVRWEPPYLRFFVLSHNAVRGGAGGSVLNAELVRARGLLPSVEGAR